MTPGRAAGRGPATARLLHAEWTKLRTAPSTGWLLLAVVAVTVLVGLGTVAGTSRAQCPPDAECLLDPARLSLTGVWLGQAAVAVLAALAVTNEYGTGMIRTTLAASPGRVAVLLTRAAVVTGTVLAAGALAVAGSLLAGRIILPGNGFTAANGFPEVSLADGTMVRAATGTVLYFGLIALLSVGVGAIVRDSTGAVSTLLALLYASPTAAALLAGDPQWHEWVQRLGPATAGLAIQATTGLERLPIAPWPGLGVLAGYAGASLLLGAIGFRLRDA